MSGLTPAQVERLAVLIEECAEVQQVACKILRHGYDSHHPDDPEATSNRTLLERELGDVMFAVGLMAGEDVCEEAVEGYANDAIRRKFPYLHHNFLEEET